MRVQMDALRQKAKLGGSSRSGKRAKRQQHATDALPEDLAVTAARRIRALDLADPDRKQKVMRVFLESVLLSELGVHLASDPAFMRMVDHVQLQLESHADLSRSMNEAAELLIHSAGD